MRKFTVENLPEVIQMNRAGVNFQQRSLAPKPFLPFHTAREHPGMKKPVSVS